MLLIVQYLNVCRWDTVRYLASDNHVVAHIGLNGFWTFSRWVEVAKTCNPKFCRKGCNKAISRTSNTSKVKKWMLKYFKKVAGLFLDILSSKFTDWYVQSTLWHVLPFLCVENSFFWKLKPFNIKLFHFILKCKSNKIAFSFFTVAITQTESQWRNK